MTKPAQAICLVALLAVAAACSSDPPADTAASEALESTAGTQPVSVLANPEVIETTATPGPSIDTSGIVGWPMFGYDRTRSASSQTTGIASSPRLRWRFSTEGTVESSPAVVGGVVYEGTFNLGLMAVDADTGGLRWHFPVGGLLRGSPAVEGGVVYFGADDDRFYAVDADSGQQLWVFELGRGGEQSSAAVVDGTVYFGAFDRNVYALDAATGEEVWRFGTGAGILSSPAVAEGTVFIGSIDGNLYALDSGTGEKRWSVADVRVHILLAFCVQRCGLLRVG